jgi:hypothetical protein
VIPLEMAPFSSGGDKIPLELHAVPLGRAAPVSVQTGSPLEQTM